MVCSQIDIQVQASLNAEQCQVSIELAGMVDLYGRFPVDDLGNEEVVVQVEDALHREECPELPYVKFLCGVYRG